MLLKLNDNKILSGIIIVLLLFFLIVFKFTGLKLIGGFILVFVLPLYLLLDLFNFSLLERIVYAFFLGAGVIPTFVYYLGLLISFKLSIFVVVSLLILARILVKKHKLFTSPQQPQNQ